MLAHVVLQPNITQKINKLQSLWGQHVLCWGQCEKHWSILALGTFPSAFLKSPHYLLCWCSHMSSLSDTDIYGFVQIETVSVPWGCPSSIHPHPNPLCCTVGSIRLCCLPSKALIYPLSISQIDWTAGTQTGLYTRQSTVTDSFLGFSLREVERNRGAWIDGFLSVLLSLFESS